MADTSSVLPVQLSLESKFQFRCHPAISCFTKCCSNIDIMLTPYDIVVMKKRLGLTSDQFLEKYTYINADEKGAFPFIYLAMNQDAERKCPFLTAEGCSVYEDRPASCRYYPIGQGTLKKSVGEDKKPVDEEFYFFIREEHCKGFQEAKDWTVGEWRQDQGVDRYDLNNREWKGIILFRNVPGFELDDKKQKMFYLACYDMDRFRSFVFGSGFLDRFEVDGETIEKIKGDDLDLMQFGFRFAKYILMMEQTLKAK